MSSNRDMLNFSTASNSPFRGLSICAKVLQPDNSDDKEQLLQREQNIILNSSEVATQIRPSSTTRLELREIKLERFIASGGMGHIFEAKMLSDAKSFALKVLQK